MQGRRSYVATSNLTKLSDEELVSRQQEIMRKRGEAERGFKEEASEVQFELDKRAFKQRFGVAGPTPAELAAFEEMAKAVTEEGKE
jgi:hypothetical protein